MNGWRPDPNHASYGNSRFGGRLLAKVCDMTDQDKTREELLCELESLRKRVDGLAALSAERKTLRLPNRVEEGLPLRHILDVYDRDRQLLAYEIHDGFAQLLTAATCNFQTFSQLRDSNPAEAQKAFDSGLQLLGEGMAEVRRLIGGLRPPILDETGLVKALDHLVGESKQQNEPEIVYVHDVQFERLAAPLENAVYRIVQESLTNARRHSKSPRILIRLTQHNRNLRVEVQDWGVGFDPRAVPRNRFGLEGIRERARLFGGQATIESAVGQGTRIVVELPMMDRTDDVCDTPAT